MRNENLTLLQFDFPFDGPWGSSFAEAFSELARDIAQEDGLVFKIWTENETEGQAGGIYVFRDRPAAERYRDKHSQRLAAFGVQNVRARIFSVNLPLSAITRATF